MASTSETGLQLFARLIPRPSLVGLDNTLFPEGPNAKDVIEISGDPSTGKTLLFHQFIAKSILPKEFNRVQLGGLKSGVVLINTDHHFQMLKLIAMMENHLNCVNNFSVSNIEKVIKESLDRLIIYNITDSVQLQTTFYALQSLVSNQPEIGLVLLDSVCAFYWQDSLTSGIRKMDFYTTSLIRVLQKCLGDFKGVIMYSRPSYFQSKLAKSESSKTGLGFANHKIVLKKIMAEDRYSYMADVETSNGNSFKKAFTISSSGIQWVE
ncbi:DNA repair protein XRCC2 [Macrosteles quadrilineatus]|uniref:DNA repair protein XRCC2 n=1 Tax=Macrosteles quadrilineatus TaxID=74068 RepID=UPI0023E1A729|nr:DNA repair protein XRCC2 [Macrosteles quadrilineatus]